MSKSDRWAEEHRLPWEPLAPEGLVELFAGTQLAWFVAGGQALARFVGHSYRDHADIDVVLFRGQLAEARRALSGWEVFAADPPGRLRPWDEGEVLPSRVHDLWCRRAGEKVWRLQIMVATLEASESRPKQEVNDLAASWIYRRDPRIGGPLRKFGSVLRGLPCLRPEIQLLYKSKEPRPKDELDFEMCLPLLGPEPKRDLVRWLKRLYGSGAHSWQARLESASGAELRELSAGDEPAFRDMAEEFESEGEPRFRQALADWPRFLGHLDKMAHPSQPEGRVPSKSFFLWQGDQMVGSCRLRLALTDGLMEEGGHIGYQIRPGRRGQGFGREILRLALEKSDEHGIRRVRITCDDDNIRSSRVIEGQGGVLDDKGISPESGKLVRRYWIERRGLS